MAFKIAGSMAFKEACRKAGPVLQEPMMKVSVTVPDEYMGNVMGDLNARRGEIRGQRIRNGAIQIDAFVPLAEMFGYATDLRSRTQGRGNYTMEPSHYVQIPKSIAEKIIVAGPRRTKVLFAGKCCCIFPLNRGTMSTEMRVIGPYFLNLLLRRILKNG